MLYLSSGWFRYCVHTVFFVLLVNPLQCFATGYSIEEIPIPSQISIPNGLTARPVCLDINQIGQVACHLEIIETLTPSQIDRFAKEPKVFASYAYRWDRRTKKLLLLSTTASETLDRVRAINDLGWIAGSKATVGTAPKATIWPGIAKAKLLGAGVVTDINNQGDYVMNGHVFVNGKKVVFPGKQVYAQVLSNSSATLPLKVAGLQAFSSLADESGFGLFYRVAPTTKPKPWFALSGIRKDVFVNDVTDNGNFVISGLPNTAQGQLALSCSRNNVCQFYSPTVDTSGRTKPWISLNSINKKGQAVGTDSGIAILIRPPSVIWPNGERLFLNQQLPQGVYPSWFLNNATSVNDRGQIVGTGLHNGKKAVFLLTPI